MSTQIMSAWLNSISNQKMKTFQEERHKPSELAQFKALTAAIKLQRFFR